MNFSGLLPLLKNLPAYQGLLTGHSTAPQKLFTAARAFVVAGAATDRAGPVLVVEVFRVDSGALLWSGQFDVGGGDLRQVRSRVGMEVTEALNLPR